MLEHEKLGLPKYFVVKKKEGELRDRFMVWFRETYSRGRSGKNPYYGYDGSTTFNGEYSGDSTENFINKPKLITLEERDRIVNGNKTRNNYTYETTVTRSDGTVFTKDTIGGVTLSDLEAEKEANKKRNRDINGLLKSHRSLFDN